MEQPTRPREFQQRVTPRLDRSRVRHAALKARGRKLLKKRYTTLMLGATLALGGVGVPMRMAMNPPNRVDTNPAAVNEITAEVLSGMTAAAEGVQSAMGDVASISPQKVAVLSEQAREEYFRNEVPFGSVIYDEAKKNDLAPELVAAVVKTESHFRPNAKSSKNAQGLMQLVPRTGKWMGAKNLLNPKENVRAGTKYLKYLSERFDGDERMVIAAYNAGEGNVRKFGGIPPYRETREYIKKVEDSQAEFHEQVAGKIDETVRMADISLMQEGR